MYNTAIFCTPSGEVYEQDKINSTTPEKLWGYSGGRDLNVFKVRDVKIGLAICYDVEFPELVRALK